MAAICKICNASIETPIYMGERDGYKLVKCPHCETTTVDPFPTDKQLMDFYQSYIGSNTYRVKPVKKINRALKRIRNLQKYTGGTKFLDVGCNNGFTVAAALKLNLDAHGIDIDNDAVNQSKKDFGQDKFDCVSVMDYATTGVKADIVYSSEVIEHVPEPQKFVEAIAKILNKGGVLYLTTPDAAHFRVPKDFASWYAVTPPSHIFYFTRKGLRNLLEKHGLKVEKFQFSFKPGIKLIARKI